MMYERMLLGTAVPYYLHIAHLHAKCLLRHCYFIDVNAPSQTIAMADVAPVCRHNDQHL